MQQTVGSPSAPVTASTTLEGQLAQARATFDNLMRQRLELQIAIAQRPANDRLSAEAQVQMEVLEKKIGLAQFEVGRVERQVAEERVLTTSTAPAFPRLPSLPNEYVLLGSLFILVAFLPLSIAFARRLWRRGENEHVGQTLAADVEQRLLTMQTSIDSVAMEVERIGEGQRYVTGLLHTQLTATPPEAKPQVPEVAPRRELYRAVTPH